MKAPEYGMAADVWSTGALFYELYHKLPMFQGTCEIDQIFKIFMFTGHPTKITWPEFEQCEYHKTTFPKFKPADPAKYCDQMDE